MEKRSANKEITYAPEIIVITGAESTGKSALTKELADYFDVTFFPELARNYIENLDRKYTYSDVEEIARLQIDQYRQSVNSKIPYVFLDTWLIITKIWFDVVFKREPYWLNEEIRNTKVDLFLVCDIDLPWIPDPVRENGGEMRKILHNRYIETISQFNFKYKIISGKNSERLKLAINYIAELQ